MFVHYTEAISAICRVGRGTLPKCNCNASYTWLWISVSRYLGKISSIFLHSKCMKKSCNKGGQPNRKYLYTMPVKCGVVGKPLCIQVYLRDLINPTCHLEMKVTFTFGAKSRLRI